jgi:hypothetical protein
MRQRTTQRQSWDSKRTQEAVDEVGAAKFTPSAPRHFGVCRTKLRRHLRYDAVPKGMGRNRISLQKLSKNWLTTSPNGGKMVWSSMHEVES